MKSKRLQRLQESEDPRNQERYATGNMALPPCADFFLLRHISGGGGPVFWTILRSRRPLLNHLFACR